MKFFGLLFLALLLLTSCNSASKQIIDSDTRIHRNLVPTASITQQEGTIEVNQSFNDCLDSCLTPIYTLDIQNKSFVMLSAYTLDAKSDCHLFYRINSDHQWKELPEDQQANNPGRKVFAAVNLFTDINQIQFKSTLPTQENVIFRLYLAN